MVNKSELSLQLSLLQVCLAGPSGLKREPPDSGKEEGRCKNQRVLLGRDCSRRESNSPACFPIRKIRPQESPSYTVLGKAVSLQVCFPIHQMLVQVEEWM